MPSMSIGSQADQQVIVDRAKALSGCRCAYGPGGSGGLWLDQINAWGTPADLSLQGAAAWSGGGVVLDGSAGCYLQTSTTPAFATGIAGSTLVQADTLNYAGFTLGLIAAFQAADLDAGPVLMQWHTGANQKFALRVQPGTGYLEIWLASASQGGSYQTDPRSKPDRFVTLQHDVRRYLRLDGTPNVIQISRGTMHPPEKTAVLINGTTLHNAGTGNGIDLFVDFTTQFSLGLMQATSIVGDYTYTNLKATLFGAWMISRFVTIQEQQAIVAGFFSANRSNGLQLGLGVGV